MNSLLPNLTKGAIPKIIALDSAYEEKPLLQILMIKKYSLSENNKRSLLCLSDGELFYRYCMAAETIQNLFDIEKLHVFCVIRLERLQVFTKKSKKFIFVLEVTPVADENNIKSMIGQPQEYVLTEDLLTVPSNLPEKTAHAVSNVVFFPIESVTCYQQRWPLMVRIKYKSVTLSKKDGKGKYFKVTMADSTGEIGAVAYDSECERFENILKINKLYYVSRAQVKYANKLYSKVNNDYELHFTNLTDVKPCENNEPGIEGVHYKFVPFSQLIYFEIGNVIGVVNSMKDIVVLTTRQNKECQKREVNLVDDTNNEISLTLWGSITKDLDAHLHPTIILQGVKLTDFGKRSLSTTPFTSIEINPDLSKANQLRCWYDNGGKDTQFFKISTPSRNEGMRNAAHKTLSDVSTENLGSSHDYSDFFKVKAMVISINKEKALYKSCPEEKCNKKMVDLADGRYRCEKCQVETENFHWRLLLSITIADASSHLEVVCFQEKAEILLGHLSGDVGELKESDQIEFDNVFEKANFKSYIFGISMKMDNIKNGQKKSYVYEIWDINYETLSDRLKEEIKRMEIIE